MHPRRRPLQIVLILLPLLVLLLVGAAWLWLRAGYPQANGTLRLRGLEQSVTVRRDRYGVPHLYARSEHDLYFAQGVVHAQDRLWQMDFQRRIGQARLSEMFGNATLETDRFLRTIGTPIAAQRDYAALSEEAKTILQAYADGVNAYVESGARLPVEYQLLGIDFEPWQPADTVAWAKVMQWDLSDNWETELFRARLIEAVGEEQAALLMGDGTPVGNAESVSIGNPDLTTLRQAMAAVNRPLSGSVVGLGSNGWAVAGDRTDSGRPLLAADPHLGPSMPSIWYEIGLHGPGLDLVGASFPGAPGIVIGHNGHIAWGVTTLYVDTQDLFIERVDEQAGTYEWKGDDLPLAERTEVIHVKGGADVELRVRSTRHGPLMNDILPDLEQPVAFQWRAAAQESHLIESLIALNRATNRAEFLNALTLWDSPPQNFIYADEEGNIALVAAGEVPIRPAAGGMLPQPGWRDRWEWRGVIPFDEMPQLWNPPEGFVANGNNNPFPPEYEYYTGDGWGSPYRVERIGTMIEERSPLSIPDLIAMQQDVRSPTADRLVPLLLDIPSDDLIVQRMQEQLQTWNREVEGRLPGAGIYEVVQGFIARELVADELGDALTEEYLGYSHKQIWLVQQLLDQPDHLLWDDSRTPETERRDDILARALTDTREWLGRRYGDVPHEWFWDRLHTVTFDHPIGSQPPLDRLFNRTIPADGDRTTVNANGFAYPDGYAVDNMPSYRQVVDVGSWGGSQMLFAPGQSGNPFHPHFADLIGPWQRGELGPMLWSPGQVEAASEGRVLVLAPR